MSIDTPKRFDRIIAILIQLQSKRIVKAQELADRFQVSLRTIYRDIRTLESCGVPIYSEAGVGYSIMDGYRLPPIMFTKEEAGSFVAAEKLMHHFTDKTLGTYYESAMFKIKSVLRGSEKDWVNLLESHVNIYPSQNLFNDKIPNALEVILESIALKRQTNLLYKTFEAETASQRNVEPVGLFHENNYWYVLAYCHLRKDYREFRTDRIEAIQTTEISFLLSHGSIEQHRKKYESDKKVIVRISVNKNIAKFIQMSKKHYGFISEKKYKDKIEMTFNIAHYEEGFCRWFLMFGDQAKILEPIGLKEDIHKLLSAISKNV